MLKTALFGDSFSCKSTGSRKFESTLKMTEEYANFKHSVEGDGDNWLSLLRTLNRDEIFEVLSQGFCQNCQALFETRLRSFINGNIYFLNIKILSFFI